MTSSGLLHSLQAVTRAHPTSRKLLVTPDINLGRELLATLARVTGGWIGWEATNLRGIAEDLAFVPLAERGVRAGSDVEIAALVNRALDAAIATGRVSAHMGTLQGSLGFRRALRDALLALRTAGISGDSIRAANAIAPGSPAHDLPAVLEKYESLLARHNLTDPAGLLRAALDAFERESPFVLDGEILLAPNLVTRGLPGQLLERLIAHGARPLAADRLIGAAVPSAWLAHLAQETGVASLGQTEIQRARCSSLAWLATDEICASDDQRLDATAITTDFFAASTPAEELREVCRRLIAEGCRWDEVEIVATDVDTYGVALDALCQQLDIGATMFHGVPLARTRLGRALDRWLCWLEEGLPADVLRESLEAGELHTTRIEIQSTVIARELRRLAIGWGRRRYAAALEELDIDKLVASLTRYDDESEEEFVHRQESRRHSLEALTAFLEELLPSTPEVPERGSHEHVRSSCALLARATLKWLELVPLHDMAEQQTAARLRTRLTQLSEIAEEDTSFSNALAALRDALSDLRAWPLVTSDRKPWSAAGGMLHLTDVAHAGATGRRRMFVVGLDPHRTQAASRQDPLLPDSACRAIDSASLATTIDRRDEAAYALAHSLASLRGRVTLSYSMSGSADGRDAGPASVLLQAWRIARADGSLSYQQLRDELNPPACAVPSRNGDAASPTGALIDARDVWFDAIADGAMLLNAGTRVAAAFSGLDVGLRAIVAANSHALTMYSGLAPAAGPLLDPRAHGEKDISPSALEKLASCPLAWFYRYGLKLYAPDEPVYDPDRWLDESERGLLLHELFETFCRDYKGRQQELREDGAVAHLNEITAQAIARWRKRVPPPSEMVFERESEELRRSSVAFLHMERADVAHGEEGEWIEFELEFGQRARDALYPLPDGSWLKLKGKADRVDRLADGTMRVIDYKTGRSSRFEKNPKAGAFNGGRHLQPALYTGVIGALVNGTVSQFEYRFPTPRGQSEIIGYSAEEFASVPNLITDLLNIVRTGEFIPTDDDADCKYCDHKEICRVTHGRFDFVSPRADWAKENTEHIAAYDAMRARRGQGGIA
jgi:hypothetical protein